MSSLTAPHVDAETQPPETGSWIEVDASNIRFNLRGLMKEVAPARLCFVVKADAYGHGVETVVPAAESAGVEDFAVFSSHEAWHVLRASSGRSRIQIMGHMAAQDMRWAARHGLEPWINDEADWAACEGATLGRNPLRVHIEVETGMHRTGLLPETAVEVAKQATDADDIELAGICTHLAGAEDSRNSDRIGDQLETFRRTCDAIEEAGIPLPPRHVASSSAALVLPECRMDLVRVGIAGYGNWPTPEVKQRYKARDERRPLELRRALAWKTRIMATQQVPAGSFVGYGKAYCTPRDTTIAILPVGYGDGFSRSLSNAGQVLIGGMRCPIVGQINMNTLQVDIGDMDVGPGEVAVLIGTQGSEAIGVHSFAEAQETVNYELMARLSQDIPRYTVDPEAV